MKNIKKLWLKWIAHSVGVFLLSSNVSAQPNVTKLRTIDQDGNIITRDQHAYLSCYDYEYIGQCENLRSIPDIDESEKENSKPVTPEYLSYEHKNYQIHMFGIADSFTFYSNITVNKSGKIFASGGAGLQFISGYDDPTQAWQRRFYSRFSDSFRDIKLVDSELFATGDAGVIYRSRNFGGNWEVFNEVYFNSFSAQDLKDESIHKEWLRFYEKTKELSFEYSGAYSIAFDLFSTANQKKGVVVGSQKILRTDDSGQHWSLVDYSLKDIVLQEATFSQSNHVWAVGSLDTVLHSKDGGRTWERQPALKKDAHWLTIDFSNKKHGCLAGSGEIWCTNNAGQSWERSTIKIDKNVEMGYRISRLRWLNDREGWAVVTTGQILKTQDGGKNWVIWHDVNQINSNFSQVQLWGLYVDKVNQKMYSAGTLIMEGDAKSEKFQNGGVILTWKSK